MKVITSRAFNQDVSLAKRAARTAPVFVTDRGKATHVLLSVEAYLKLTGERESIVDLLALPDGVAGEVSPGRLPDLWKGRDPG
jgi:hypothetical protein